MAAHDVSDPTDWHSTPLAGLAAVESALRCQMCKEFYKTPMLTSCSHTFCSLCIRHALANDNCCPLCRKVGQASQLRNNWSLEEAVEAFKNARKAALDLATRGPVAPQPRSPKRKLADRPGDAEERETKRLRSSARLSGRRGHGGPTSTTQTTAVMIPDSDAEEEEGHQEEERGEEDDTFVPDDGLVPCPMCQTRMKEVAVFSHLDNCTGPPSPKHNSSSRNSTPRGQPSPFPAESRRPQAPPQPAPERLPTLAYSMLKDVALRKKMNELGISSNGPRQLLELRHMEWINLWNANCDSSSPKPRAALLQELGAWERTVGASAAGQAGFSRARPGAEIKDKDFDVAAWSARHDTGFRDLIASARANRPKAQTKNEEKEEPSEKPTSDASVQPSADEATPGQGEDAGPMSGVEKTPGEAVRRPQQPPPGPPAVALPTQHQT